MCRFHIVQVSFNKIRPIFLSCESDIRTRHKNNFCLLNEECITIERCGTIGSMDVACVDF